MLQYKHNFLFLSVLSGEGSEPTWVVGPQLIYVISQDKTQKQDKQVGAILYSFPTEY